MSQTNNVWEFRVADGRLKEETSTCTCDEQLNFMPSDDNHTCNKDVDGETQ